jgi:predicted ATPase
MANPLGFDSELLLFATPEEEERLRNGTLTTEQEQTLLVELKQRLDDWRANLKPTREQLLQTTHEENRALVRMKQDTPEFWTALDADWRRKQKPSAQDVLKATKTKLQYRVYFAWDDSAFQDTNEPTIILGPSSDEWNDFAHKTKFRYSIIRPGHNIHLFSGEVHLAFLEATGTPVEYVRDRLKGSSHLKSGDLPAFYTMHSNLDAYRTLVAKLGSKNAIEFLSSINDLVALKQHKAPKWFANAVTSEDFTLSFMRSSETFFAFHNAGYVLRGREHKEASGISRDLVLTFRLAAFENDHQLKFKFEHIGKIPKRIVVIIGKNGVGKSQALSNIVQSLVRDDQRLRDSDRNRPSINRLIAVSSPGETKETFPTPRRDNRIDYRRIILSSTRTANEQEGLGAVLVQLARSDERIRRKGRWDIFCEAVSTVMDLDQVFVQVRKEHEGTANRVFELKPVPLSRFRPSSEQKRLELWGQIDSRALVCRYINGEALPLSSGESTFIRFAAIACLYIENGTLLLFDEPETHLHPNLITQFIRLVDQLLKMTGSFAVLATHSAYFVREVPGSQVLILTETHRKVDVTNPRLKTLGADIGAISFFVFGDELYGRLLREMGARLIEDNEEPRRLLKEMEEDLSDEAFMYLRRELIEKKDS